MDDTVDDLKPVRVIVTPPMGWPEAISNVGCGLSLAIVVVAFLILLFGR